MPCSRLFNEEKFYASEVVPWFVSKNSCITDLRSLKEAEATLWKSLIQTCDFNLAENKYKFPTMFIYILEGLAFYSNEMLNFAVKRRFQAILLAFEQTYGTLVDSEGAGIFALLSRVLKECSLLVLHLLSLFRAAWTGNSVFWFSCCVRSFGTLCGSWVLLELRNRIGYQKVTLARGQWDHVRFDCCLPNSVDFFCRIQFESQLFLPVFSTSSAPVFPILFLCSLCTCHQNLSHDQLNSLVLENKTRTSKVGAISKAQKAQNICKQDAS